MRNADRLSIFSSVFSAAIRLRPMTMARQEYLEALADHARVRYRLERRDPHAELVIDPRHLSTAAAVAECLVIGLADPGRHGQALQQAVHDVVSVAFSYLVSCIYGREKNS